ncbi:FtsQ-type POTRA domain-containing protein [Microterricola viridarii]|uniref:Uncharacterized protein n=1 Tax=Microterricola viridarii TaxID=412690 RepID=A0A0X8E3A7_9MICO|nr:FtsQ-type POTRA domain-containing protein [Microterricola viridarii]AMB58707.1 hypothetical protein AWU67_07360 [Microterricola viridarii]
MKRPQGIEHTAKPAPASVPAAAPGGTPAAPDRPAPRAQAGRRGPLPTAWWMQKPAAAPAGPATPEAVTEPIAVQEPAVAAAAGPASTGPLAPVTPLTAALPRASQEPAEVPGESPSTADSPSGDAAEQPEALTPSSARARLRAATRARRAYERAEVRRFTRHLRRRRAAWLTGIGAVVALALFVAVGTFSPLMALTTIQVEGTNRLAADEVSTALSGQVGTPLPLVDHGQIKSDLAAFPLIQSFSTESRPPNTLVVRVVERDPIGAIAGEGGFRLVDPAGVVIQTTAERPAGFPILEATGDDGLVAAGSVIQALPAEIRGQLDVVRAASTDDVNLVLTGGASVAWGSAEESALKAVVLGKLMVAAPLGTVSVYDVSSPASAVVR